MAVGTGFVKMRYNTYLILLLSLLLVLVSKTNQEAVTSDSNSTTQRPHIIIIYADDLGWNDVSFHGSPEIPTPNIDALAMNGIVLNNYYGENLCTPSRAALLTGKYPMRLGLQHSVLKPGEASGLPLNEVTLPQRLKTLGYDTHMVGKWHLGYMKKEYLPTFRGFNSFFGYYNGALDYYDYTADIITELPDKPFFYGMDLYNGTELVKDFRGKYATHVFTDKAKDIISNHDASKPLFLYLAHLAVHAGNRNDPLQAPPEAVRKFNFIKNRNRKVQAAMTSVLDDSVGDIIEALKAKNMLENSIVMFASDNGGNVNGVNDGYSSNYPLRGKKKTLWEGGIRVPAFIWSPLLNLRGPQVSYQLMHVSDWLPTFYSAAGGEVKELGDINGKSMWNAFLQNLPSPRTELLHGMDPIIGYSALRIGDWKLINGTSPEGYEGWYGPKGIEFIDVPESMEKRVLHNGSKVRGILDEAGLWITQDIDGWYRKSRVMCSETFKLNSEVCHPLGRPMLFNVRDDPCETLDLAHYEPKVIESMLEALIVYQKSAVFPQSKPSDRRAYPMCYHLAHVTWLEEEYAEQYKICDIL